MELAVRHAVMELIVLNVFRQAGILQQQEPALDFAKIFPNIGM